MVAFATTNVKPCIVTFTVSIPPEYDEAVDWPNDHSRSRHSRLRNVTRSRSAGRPASSASRGPNFARLFSRSISATTGATGR